MLAVATCWGVLWFWILILGQHVYSEASYGVEENFGFWLLCTAFIAVGSVAAALVLCKVWRTDLAWYSRWGRGLALVYLRVLVALELFFALFCVADVLSFGRIGMRFEWQVPLIGWPAIVCRDLVEESFGLLCINLVLLLVLAELEVRLMVRCTRPA